MRADLRDGPAIEVGVVGVGVIMSKAAKPPNGQHGLCPWTMVRLSPKLHPRRPRLRRVPKNLVRVVRGNAVAAGRVGARHRPPAQVIGVGAAQLAAAVAAVAVAAELAEPVAGHTLIERCLRAILI